jgi:predicted amidohydrolase YtcJ
MRADLLIVNGRVWPPSSGSTALAIAGETILAVGGDPEIRELAGPDTRLIDAADGSVIPAFNDAHVHFLNGARSLAGLNLWGARDLVAVEKAISEHLAANPDRSWLVGRGWEYGSFPGGMPALELLDGLCPDRPAFLECYDGHTAWVNSAALRIARAVGEPLRTGILKESAMALVESRIPLPSLEEDLALLRRAMAMAASRGVASVQEAGAGQAQLAHYQALLERDELVVRVRLGLDLPPGLDAAAWEKRLTEYEELVRPNQDRWVRTGILKAFADGVVESGTATMLEPYEDGSRGEPNWDWAELREAVAAADRRGWQVQIHAIGDAAVRASLDAYENAAAKDPAGDRRHRVEHVETIAAADVARFGRLGVIASMQPSHAEPGRNLLDAWAPRIGPERAARGWAWRSILEAGGRLAFGSDWPVVPLDPAHALHVAATRTTTTGEPAGGWQPGQRLTVEQAVDAHTAGAAFAEHAEGWKGTLRAGHAADVAVLNEDLTREGVDLAGLKVALTVVGGRVVYEEGAASG